MEPDFQLVKINMVHEKVELRNQEGGSEYQWEQHTP